jgi:hypothetical protein
MTTNRKRACALVRVSSEEQARGGYGLEFQEEDVKAFCERNKLDLVKVFRDEVVGNYERKERRGEMGGLAGLPLALPAGEGKRRLYLSLGVNNPVVSKLYIQHNKLIVFVKGVRARNKKEESVFFDSSCLHKEWPTRLTHRWAIKKR